MHWLVLKWYSLHIIVSGYVPSSLFIISNQMKFVFDMSYTCYLLIHQVFYYVFVISIEVWWLCIWLNLFYGCAVDMLCWMNIYWRWSTMNHIFWWRLLEMNNFDVVVCHLYFCGVHLWHYVTLGRLLFIMFKWVLVHCDVFSTLLRTLIGMLWILLYNIILYKLYILKI